jgi:hypothetical protein
MCKVELAWEPTLTSIDSSSTPASITSLSRCADTPAAGPWRDIEVSARQQLVLDMTRRHPCLLEFNPQRDQTPSIEASTPARDVSLSRCAWPWPQTMHSTLASTDALELGRRARPHPPLDSGGMLLSPEPALAGRPLSRSRDQIAFSFFFLGTWFLFIYF